MTRRVVHHHWQVRLPATGMAPRGTLVYDGPSESEARRVAAGDDRLSLVRETWQDTGLVSTEPVD